MALKRITTGGGDFFKPEEYRGAEALLVEVTGYEAQVPTTYGPKDTITATITAFATLADIDERRFTKVIGTQIQQTALVKKLRDEVGVGSETVVRLNKLTGRNGQNGAWVWDQVHADAWGKIEAFVEGESEAEEAEASDEMPDFLK